VQGAWIRFVRELKRNRKILGEAADLGEFMFGSERSGLAPFLRVLSEVQGRDCFYCLERIGGEVDVDHFIPWSRYPLDLGNNFVLAHPRCNRRKGDRLAAFEHLERWCDRNRDFGEALRDAFDRRGLVHDLHASLGVTRWAYQQVEGVRGKVWLEGEVMVNLNPAWRDLPDLAMNPQ
jgi:5-methylcytosine-specific restriction endonuclease McrA